MAKLITSSILLAIFCTSCVSVEVTRLGRLEQQIIIEIPILPSKERLTEHLGEQVSLLGCERVDVLKIEDDFSYIRVSCIKRPDTLTDDINL
ncbi:MAG: hypothetical protein ACXAC5_03980 [Promethearchaeota archaeon]|jgi:hypothetical protein